MNFLSILFLLITFSFLKADFSDVACSGFVEFPQEDTVDFNRIEIQLLSEEGKILDQTQCSENGFFLLPIYDRKNYVLKIVSAENLAFTPSEIRFDLQTKPEAEIRKIFEEMHNFKFSGFIITSKIFASDQSVGPSNVLLTLSSLSGSQIASKKTIENGLFTFENLAVGSYLISAQESSENLYQVSKDQNSIKCDIAYSKPLSCDGKIIINGFLIRGRILNENQPLENFYIFLYSKEKTMINYKCNDKIIVEHPLKERNYICYVKSDNLGMFSFFAIPPGEYLIAIKSFELEKKIDIEPSFQNLVLKNEPLVKDFNFEVNKFTISGNVVDSKGNGITGVKISLDGEVKGVSDNQGKYLLEKIKTGTYTLEGIHEHLFFETLHDLKLSLNLKQIPNLQLSYIHLCGQVLLNFENLGNEEYKKFKITIYLESIESRTEKRSTLVDSSGNYCFEVRPGNYSIHYIVSGIEKGIEISLTPKKYIIEATNQPRLDLNFYRPKVSVEGLINFFSDTPQEVKAKTTITIFETNKKIQQVVGVQGDRQFIFTNVLSGSYEISVQNEDLCFENKKINIEITQNNNITDIKFNQSGFTLQYEANQDVEVSLLDPNEVSKLIILTSQKNFICVAKSGEYIVKPAECLLFREKEFRIKTSSNRKLVLQPEKMLIQGRLKFESSKIVNVQGEQIIEKLKKSFIENNYLTIETYEKNILIEKNSIVIQFEKIDATNNLIFLYKHYVKPFTSNKITALITSNKDKKNDSFTNFLENLLFYPSERKINIINKCALANNDFEIKSGLVINGQINPINVTNISISIYKETKTGLELLKSFVAENNKFKVGPLVDSFTYQIVATKENYKFHQNIEKGQENSMNVVLTAQRLSSLKIKIKDENGVAIPNVLIFISSTSKKNLIRMNNYTNSEGVFYSNNFVTGEYLIKTVLKEYLFNPAQKTIKILDGATEEIEIVGKKVAFSIFGKVSKLNYEGVANVQVDVQEQKENELVDVENSITNENGLFRIRGLEPNKKYNLSLKAKASLEYYKPQFILVDMKNQDIQDMEFLAFEKKTKNTISGSIVFDPKFSLEEKEEITVVNIELFAFANQEIPLENRKLFFGKYFEFDDLEKTKYIVKLTYRRTKNSLNTEVLKLYDFSTLERGIALHEEILIEKVKADSKKDSQSFSLFGPIIILILVISMLNLDKTQDLLSYLHISFFKKNQQVSLGKKNK